MSDNLAGQKREQESSRLRIALTDEQAVIGMIESRRWWIFIGADGVYDEIERQFYPQADQDHSFVTMFGPPPGPFRAIAPGGRFIVLHFGRKDRLSAERLQEFMNQHRERQGIPPVSISDGQDIIAIFRTPGHTGGTGDTAEGL